MAYTHLWYGPEGPIMDLEDLEVWVEKEGIEKVRIRYSGKMWSAKINDHEGRGKSPITALNHALERLENGRQGKTARRAK